MTWAVDTATRTLAQEARGEQPDGQSAVVWVMRNRVAAGRWGDNIASVCLWHAQFSGWWCPRGTPPNVYHDPNFAYATGLGDDDPLLVHLRGIMTAVLVAPQDQDPVGGATHYYSIDIAPPNWVDEMVFTVQIGKHRFYKDKGAQV